MMLNKKQKDSLAKYVYDLSKVVFTLSVVGQLIAGKEFKLWVFISGIIMTVLFFILGLTLEKEEI